MGYIEHPLPRTKRIKAAHDEGRSVWTVQRSGGTLKLLDGVLCILMLFSYPGRMAVPLWQSARWLLRSPSCSPPIMRAC